MSGRILPEIQPNMATENELKDFPIMVVHGTRDQVIPIQNGRASNELLSGLPVNLLYKEYDMGHEISSESLADILVWLGERLDE